MYGHFDQIFPRENFSFPAGGLEVVPLNTSLL
jgi:hypothetical protein